jgi:hypothetical protein
MQWPAGLERRQKGVLGWMIGCRSPDFSQSVGPDTLYLSITGIAWERSPGFPGRVKGGRREGDCGPGGDLLFRTLGCSTIGAEGFHGRVRDGIGCLAPRYGHQAGNLAPARRGPAQKGGGAGVCHVTRNVSVGRRRLAPDMNRGVLPLHAGGVGFKRRSSD